MYKVKELKNFCSTIQKLISENERLESEVERLNKQISDYEEIFNKINELRSSQPIVERKVEEIGNSNNHWEEIGNSNNHWGEYVDLGLPSGRLWAKCNIGADSETDFGSFFAWGSIYPYIEGKDKVCGENYNKSEASKIDGDLSGNNDTATVSWGSKWKMPSKEDYEELQKHCYWEWVEDFNGSGHNGYKVMKKDDHSVYIFLPAAGNLSGLSHNGVGAGGYYWSSSFYSSSGCWGLSFDSSDRYVSSHWRGYGFSVRPVRA